MQTLNENGGEGPVGHDTNPFLRVKAIQYRKKERWGLGTDP